MDPAPEHASHQSRRSCIDTPNGSVPVGAKQQPNGVEPAPLSTTGFPATRSSASGPAPSPPATAVPLWLLRIWVVIRVAFFIELGMFLVVLPWWPRAWAENSLLAAYPSVRFFLQNNFVRGLISGLGFLDIGFGVGEAVRYKEPPRSGRPS